MIKDDGLSSVGIGVSVNSYFMISLVYDLVTDSVIEKAPQKLRMLVRTQLWEIKRLNDKYSATSNTFPLTLRNINFFFGVFSPLFQAPLTQHPVRNKQTNKTHLKEIYLYSPFRSAGGKTTKSACSLMQISFLFFFSFFFYTIEKTRCISEQRREMNITDFANLGYE